MANKTGRTGGPLWIDSRSEAYKDMTDVSRETIDELIEKYDKIGKANPSAQEKIDGALILIEIAEIYKYKMQIVSSKKMLYEEQLIFLIGGAYGIDEAERVSRFEHAVSRSHQQQDKRHYAAPLAAWLQPEALCPFGQCCRP